MIVTPSVIRSSPRTVRLGGKRPVRIGVMRILAERLVLGCLDPEGGRSAVECRVLAAVVEVEMAVHHRRDLADLDAGTVEEFGEDGRRLPVVAHLAYTYSVNMSNTFCADLP